MNDELAIPQNLEAEKAVLGAVLIHNDALDVVAGLLQAGSFYRKPHQLIFEAMLELQGKRSSIELVTLSERLQQRGELDAIGGVVYLAALVDGLPHAGNIEHYAGIVREKASLRQLLKVGSKLLAAASAAEQSALDVIAEADAALMQVAADHVSGDLVPARTLMHALFPVIEEAFKNKRAITGIQTSWRDLDDLTLGLHPGTLVYLAGQTSQGKSSLALNLAVDVARQGHGVAVFSLEDSSEMIGLRALAAQSGVSMYRMRSGYFQDADWKPLSDAFSAVGASPLWIDDSSRLSVQALRAKCRRLQAAHGLGLVVVDYVQLMSAPGKHENRTREVGIISAGLKQVAKELRVTLVACAQLNREAVKDVRRPRLSDLRESASLEQDADLVWLIYRPEQHDPNPENEGLAELIVAKQKNGPTGTVKLRFEKDCFRFNTWVENHTSQQREFAV